MTDDVIACSVITPQKPPENLGELVSMLFTMQQTSAALMTSIMADLEALKRVLRAMAPEHAQALDATFAMNRNTFAEEIEKITKQLQLLRTTVSRLVQ